MNHPLLPLILIFSLVPLSPLGIDIYLPSIPEMVEAFQATDNDLKLTISIYIFALGIGQLVAGPISDRYGRKASALQGLGLYALGSLAVAVAPSITLLYAARILQGLGAAFTMVTAMAWVRDNYEGEAAGKWLSYMGGMTSVIPTVAPMLGGLLALVWGWQSGFVLTGVVALVLFILAALVLEGPTPVSAQADHEEPARLGSNLKAIATNGQFRIYSLANVFSFAGLLTYIATAPIVAMKEGTLTEIGFAVAFGIVGLFQMLMSFLAPRVVSWLGQRETIRAGLTVSVLGGVGLLMVPDSVTLAFFALATLGCAGFSVLAGTAISLNLQPFGHCAGLAASIDGCLRMVGGATIAAMLGFTGLGSVEALATTLLLALIPLLLVINDIRGREGMVGEQA